MKCFGSLTLSLAVLLSSLAFVGCGKEPGEKPDAAAGDGAATTPTNTATDTSSAGRVVVDGGDVDTGMMVDTFQLALVAKPSKLWANKMVSETVGSLPSREVKDFTTGMKEATGQGPEDLEHALVLFGVPGPEDFGPAFATRLRFKNPLDKEKLAKMTDGTEEVEHAGKTYWRQTSADFGKVHCYYVSEDGKTLMMATEKQLKAIFDGEGSKTPLGKLAAGADYSSDVTLLAVTAPARPMVKAMIEQGGDDIPQMLMTVITLIDKIDTAELYFNMSEGSILSGKMTGVDATSTEESKNTLSALVLIGQQFLGLSKQQIPAEQQEAFAPGVDLAETLLKTLKIESAGTNLTIDLPRPAGFNETIAKVRDNAMVIAEQAAAKVRGMNNMNQVLLAVMSHSVVDGRFPAQAIKSEDGKPLLSWRVALLPYLEQTKLNEQFKLDEPWDSEHNLKLAKTVVEVFSTSDEVPPGMSNILAVVGDDSVIQSDKEVSFAHVRDGTTSTIVFVEVTPDKAVPWTKPNDYKWDPKNPAAGLGMPDEDTFIAGFADGHVERISKKIAPEKLAAMFTKSGGEVIGQDASEGPGEDAADDQFREDTPDLNSVPKAEDTFEQRENKFERNEEDELSPQDKLDEQREPIPVP